MTPDEIKKIQDDFKQILKMTWFEKIYLKLWIKYFNFKEKFFENTNNTKH